MSRRILILPPRLRELRCEDQDVQRFANEDLNLAVAETFASFQSLLRPPQFIAPTLLNSWVNYGSVYADAGYYKDPFGRVHLRGLIKNGTTNIAFTLPVGYRPSGVLIFIQQASDGANYVSDRVDVEADGDVVIYGYAPLGASVPQWVSLSGISFAAV